MDTPQHAILYTRVSTKEQGRERNGLEAQLAALHGFCEREGITPLLHLEEIASGGLGLDGRPLLAKAFALARRQGACVLVSKLDRLSREVQLIATLMNGSVLFYTAEDGLEAPPIVLHTKAMIAEHERKLIGERTRAGLSIVKARGTVLGIMAHKKDPSESIPRARALAAQARRAQADAFAQRVAPTLALLKRAGLTLAQAASELNRMGVPTAKGGEWHASTVCNALKRLDK